MMNWLDKILAGRRDKYDQKVLEAQQRLRPTPEDRESARIAITPPPEPTEAEYRRLSRSTLRYTVLFVGGLWLLYMLWESQLHLFLSNWFMSVTMVAGSFIAGSTSEGGGAVAFPVMTLIFEIHPACARNFSLAIQAVGMTAAALAIWRCRIPVEKNSVLYSSLGGAVGVIFGTFWVVPLFTNPAYTKMFFVSLWCSFAAALFMINLDRRRVIYFQIVHFKPFRAGSVLFFVGVLGGITTSLTGSGLDILTFSLLTLRYRVSEKVATPTSVVLMAINSILGFSTHLFLMPTPKNGIDYWLGDFQLEAFHYWLVCIPIVIIGAPAGARFIRNRSRHFVAAILYLSIILQFVAAILILKPWGWLAFFSLLVILGGSFLFWFLALSGRNRIDLKMPLFRNGKQLERA